MNEVKKICLDAGHIEGQNKSPCVPEYSEGTQMWKLHKMLGGILETKYKCEIIYTRDDIKNDKTVTARGHCARDCDLFLSMHSDASNNKKCDDTNRATIFYPFDGINNSDEHAQILANRYKFIMPVTNGVAKTRLSTVAIRDYYGVMRGAREVNCREYYIIENGFHTNSAQAEWLIDDEHLYSVAHDLSQWVAQILHLPLRRIKGDINGNEELDVIDYVMLKRIVLGTYQATPEQLEAADINDDGNVDIIDYVILKRKIINGEF